MSWELLIFLIILCLIFKDKEKRPSSGGKPSITFSDDPCAGIINFVNDNEALVSLGIFKPGKRSPCGCVSYTYNGEWASTDMCEVCSEKYSPF